MSEDEDTSVTQEIKVKKGNGFVLTLPGYGDSGYVWRVLDPQGSITLTKLDVVRSRKLGAQSRETLTFSCDELGTHDLCLVSIRPWEPDERESRHYKVTVE